MKKALEPMPMTGWGRGILWFVIAALFTAGSSLVYIRQESTPVSVDDALAEFRRSRESADVRTGAVADSVVPQAGVQGTTVEGSFQAGPDNPEANSQPSTPNPAMNQNSAAGATSTGSVRRPPAGVYTHTTSGFEQADAVGGSRHDYPPESSIVLRHTECGITTRWQPLEERWDEASFCEVGEALEMRKFSAYHEFFQRGQRLDYTCPVGARVFDRREPVGASWTWRCETDGATVDSVTTVVGVESVTIGGKSIQTVRMRYESALSGSTEGNQVQERWIDHESGFVVRLKSDVTARTESPFGRVAYEEHYLIETTSMNPRT